MQSRITLDTQLKITLIFSCVVGCYDYFAYGFTLFFRKALCCENLLGQFAGVNWTWKE